MRWKQNPSMVLVALLAVTGAVPLAVHAQAPDASASVDADATPSDADLAATNCAIGEERFLPGDYYYCLGTQTYGQQRYGNAKKFFATAASWASKPAQYVLGIMALNGDHQPVNRPLALAWLALASERPNSDFKSAYDSAYHSATAVERQAAEQLLTQMRPVYADATAAVRAERRYAQGMAMLSRMNNIGGSMYCMEGVSTLAQQTSNPSTCRPVQAVVQAVDRTAVNVFDGWSGHVSVGPLQEAAVPQSTSHGGN